MRVQLNPPFGPTDGHRHRVPPEETNAARNVQEQRKLVHKRHRKENAISERPAATEKTISFPFCFTAVNFSVEREAVSYVAQRFLRGRGSARATLHTRAARPSLLNRKRSFSRHKSS
ncbi:hypothetical protein TGDOM2_401050 [Toxoplasma gondii GAB2-2007-GAL-DOM2]|uniref:Uncharacterized protein n=1 Tax=Toxoplasma gondii GAB2-2007-GAL-DOM2 TaxID=1130820 RepID=A0A086JIK9_TOXGO|nr:hypothetical protein TGDOM2_401050 [Toxoplasma gondii GAB2-2007-GAL-DOM2]